jgi:hypothetical protein
LAESGGFIKAPGGAPANVACAITKLGGKSAFIGKVNLLLLAGLCTMQGTYFSPFVL